MRGLGIRMLTLDTTSLYTEDRGLQVPMTLDHDKIVGTRFCDTVPRLVRPDPRVRQRIYTSLDTFRSRDLERIHGLPAVVSPVFFPSVSRNEECWWGTLDPRTIYVWDSMDDQDKQTSTTTLQETENWVVWKTRDKTWTHTLK